MQGNNLDIDFSSMMRIHTRNTVCERKLPMLQRWPSTCGLTRIDPTIGDALNDHTLIAALYVEALFTSGMSNTEMGVFLQVNVS